MIIGHLPFGYLVSKLLSKSVDGSKINLRLFIIFGIAGAVAPDIDMFYFYLIDNRQQHHHSYWPHFPIVWVSLLLVCAIWYQVVLNKIKAVFGLIFSFCGFLHMLLDSIVGDIWWFAPFIDKSYSLFTVPALYKPWWLNFIFHWSFLLELVILFMAIILWFRNKIVLSEVNE